MKGLIFKDLYQIKKTCMLFLAVVAVLFVVSAFSDNSFIGMYAVLFISILPHTLMSYDERDKWDKYVATLPVSRKEIVSAKYIVTSLFNAAALVISFFIFLFNLQSIEKGIINCSVLVMVSVLFPSVSLPITYKFGVQKAKIVIMCLAGLLGGAGAFLVNYEYTISADAFASIHLTTALITVALALLIYALSYLISVKIYQKREL